MKIRNSRLWRSDSVRGETENSIRIESGESDPILKITKAEITFHRQKKNSPISITKLLKLKHQTRSNE